MFVYFHTIFDSCLGKVCDIKNYCIYNCCNYKKINRLQLCCNLKTRINYNYQGIKMLKYNLYVPHLIE